MLAGNAGTAVGGNAEGGMLVGGTAVGGIAVGGWAVGGAAIVGAGKAGLRVAGSFMVAAGWGVMAVGKTTVGGLEGWTVGKEGVVRMICVAGRLQAFRMMAAQKIRTGNFDSRVNLGLLLIFSPDRVETMPGNPEAPGQFFQRHAHRHRD